MSSSRAGADPRSAGERFERLLRFQSLMGAVARQIGPAEELQPVLDVVLDAMRSLVDFKGGSICLVEEGALRIAAASPAVSEEVRALRLPLGEGLAGRAAAESATVYSADLDTDPRVVPSVRSLGSNVTIRSYLAVPLVCLQQTIGVLQVDSAEPNAFDDGDRLVLEGLATQVAGAIESARRHEHILELERLKSDFIARVSHELRTPLAVVLGDIETLRSRDTVIDATTRAELLDTAARAARRLTAMIEELLSVTSFEAGTDIPRPVRVPLANVLTDVREASRTPGKVTVRCPDGLTIETDPRLLRHALALLVDNALLYAGNAELSARPGSHGVVIDVRDHGPGVAPALRDRIFERFVRGEDQAPGMGLGLPLVRTLAAGLGARVELVDPPGGGACFRVSFD